MNPRKMKQMMKQMGIDVDEIDAERVVIETADGDLVFDGAPVTKMDAQGQETYQIVGSPNRVDGAGVSGDDAADPALDEGDEDADDGDDEGIPEEDIALVAQQAGVSKADAKEALEAANGEPARAISNLQ